ncbi:unnamed protein product [Rotaria socialis]|uniref:NAD(P)(+)--arginine ADP-ribosyltransferase n=1 Tax=Rotaria socialis TaxID=392032 RepID=A0A820JHI2_9BILA|nr:unnamed protein product [Rotaria socialis]
MDEYVNIIWYDENISDQTKDILTTIHYRLFQCINIEALQKTIHDDIHNNEKILLILSGNMDHELILKAIHNERHIVLIFILVSSLDISLEAYSKIYGIYTNYGTLEKKLLVQARILNHQAVAFVFDEKLNERSMEELIDKPEVGLFDTHCRFSADRFVTSSAKESLLRYCRQRYASNPTQLKHIDEFERNYQSNDAIRWYTKDCFLFSSLNKCLRKQSGHIYDCDMVYFAADLSIQIQLEWKKLREENDVTLDPFHVYRGLNLPEDEVIQIQKYLGKSITTKGFLSTTRSCDIAKIFAANVVFDIEIDPQLENIVYADVSKYSQIPDEEEILIDFGTSFRVIDITSDADNLWIVHLVSVNEVNKVVDSYIEAKKLEHVDDVIIATGLVFFGHKERACRLLRESLNSTNDNMHKFELNCELGEIHAQSSEFTLAANYFQEAHCLCILHFPNLARLYSVTFWLAMMYACSNKYDRVFDYLGMQLEFPDPQPYSLPRIYRCSWSYLVTNEESLRFNPYRAAYNHLQQCLITYKKDNGILSKIHFCLSLIHLKCDRNAITPQPLDESLVHLKRSRRLATDKSIDFLILYYYHMGVIYESKERYHEAKRYYRRIVSIVRHNSKHNKDLILVHVRIAACDAALKMYILSIEQYIKTLKEGHMIGDSILVGKIRAHLGITYFEAHQYDKAAEQFIDVAALLDVISRPFLYEIYLIIGETLLKVNDVDKALLYFKSFLDRNENVDQFDTELWCDACERIFYIYYSKRLFGDSIINAKRMLELRKKACPHGFDEIMDTQLLIAHCYHINNDWQEAIHYFNMAYDTLGKKTSDISIQDYNPLISSHGLLIKSLLAIIYRTIHNYEQAIYHAHIALETEEKRMSRDKIIIASCYDFIGWCHYMKNEYEQALDFCNRGLHLLHTCISDCDTRCCSIYHSLGVIFLELGDIKQSFSYCMKGIHILSGNMNADNNNKRNLTHFYSLLKRIFKEKSDLLKKTTYMGNLSISAEVQQSSQLSPCIELNNIVHSKFILSTTNAQSLFTTEEENTYWIMTTAKFEPIDSSDAGDSLHMIQLDES